MKFFGLLLTVVAPLAASFVQFRDSAYHDIAIQISEHLPSTNCHKFLADLEETLTSSSSYLFSALDGRAFFGSFNIILPASWPDNCVNSSSRSLKASQGGKSDITLTATHPIYGDSAWTQQSGGCGVPGDQIFLSDVALSRSSVAHEFVREWAKYRYGVFDEIGYQNDEIYPLCYEKERDDEYYQISQKIVTGCSDGSLDGSQLCNKPEATYNLSQVVDPAARASIMYAGDQPHVVMFCDAGTHDRYAPTKHNQLCNRRSTLDVILSNEDFMGKKNKENTNVEEDGLVKTIPMFSYKKQRLTRYVLVADESRGATVRESWSFLRLAVRKWAVYDLPDKTEVGMSLTHSSAFKITALESSRARDAVASYFPYSPTESASPGCITCAVKKALQMLKSRNQTHGAASSVILLVAAGADYSAEDRLEMSTLLNAVQVRVVTINYPGVSRQHPLDQLAEQTGGSAFSVFERKYNGEKSSLATYFELTNVLSHVAREYYEGPITDLPVEIHRRELRDAGSDDLQTFSGRERRAVNTIETDSLELRSGNFPNLGAVRKNPVVSGNFWLAADMGTPASFFVYTYNPESPLLQAIMLKSPSDLEFTSRSDQRLSIKQLTLAADLNETGAWSYSIDRINGNPQPHFVQVMATPRKTNSSAADTFVNLRAWISRPVDSNAYILHAEIKKGSLPVVAALIEVTMRSHEGVEETKKKTVFQLLDNGGGYPDVTSGDGIYSRYIDITNLRPGAYSFDVTASDNGNNAYSLADDLFLDLTTRGYRCCGSFVPSPSKQPLTSFSRFLPALTIFLTEEQINAASIASPTGNIGNLRAEMGAENSVKLTWTSPDLVGKPVARYEVKYARTIAGIVDGFETTAALWPHGEPLVNPIGADNSFTLNFTLEPSLIGTPLFFAVRAYAVGTRMGASSNVVSFKLEHKNQPYTPPIIWPQHTDGGYITDDMTPSQREYIVPVGAGIVLFVAIAALCAGLAAFCLVSKRKNQKPSKAAAARHYAAQLDHQQRTQQQETHQVFQNQLQFPEPEKDNMPAIRESWTASQLLYEHERQLTTPLPPIPPLPDNFSDNFYGAPPYYSAISRDTPIEKKRRNVTMV